MRELLIQKYKQVIDSENDYWKGWGNKDHNLQDYPDFDNWTDEEILESFLKVYSGHCQARC